MSEKLPVTAVMPTEEEIREIIASGCGCDRDCDKHGPDACGCRIEAEQILALFAPILAEKERVIREMAMQALADEQQLIEAHDRRTAAEAALAGALAALKPFAEYHAPSEFLDDKGQPLHDDTHAGYVYLTMGDFRRAAAIRAGE